MVSWQWLWLEENSRVTTYHQRPQDQAPNLLRCHQVHSGTPRPDNDSAPAICTHYQGLISEYATFATYGWVWCVLGYMSGYYSSKWICYNHTSDRNMSNMQTKPRPIEEFPCWSHPLPPVSDIEEALQARSPAQSPPPNIKGLQRQPAGGEASSYVTWVRRRPSADRHGHGSESSLTLQNADTMEWRLL